MTQDQAVDARRVDVEQIEIAVHDLGRVAEVDQILVARTVARRIEMQRQPPLAGQRRHLPPRHLAHVLDLGELVRALGQEPFVERIHHHPHRQVIDDRRLEGLQGSLIGGHGNSSAGDPMAYTLAQLASDIKAALKADPSRAGKMQVIRYVARALEDKDFVATHLKDRAPGGDPREILYQDPELGFCICGHVYGKNAIGKPHDHGSSWAIYGQATGITEMTDWKVVEKGEDGKPTLVEPERTYLLKPGEAHYYDVGFIHSPKRVEPVKLIRIEGANLDHVQRSNIKAKAA